MIEFKNMSDKNVTINISTGTVIKVLSFIILVGLIYYLRDLVLILITAIVIASAIEPATKYFMKYKIPRVPAVVFVYLIVVLVFFGLFYLFIPPILDDAAGFLSTLPQYINSLNTTNSFVGDTLVSSQSMADGVNTVREFSLQKLIFDLQSSIANVSEGFIKTLNAVFGGVLSLVLIIVFSFYFAVQEKGIEDFLKIITPTKHHNYILGLWRRSQIKIGRWMQGQLLLALIIGVLTYLGLTIFGVPYALLLAVLAAVFELIPIFGPILASIPAIIISFVVGDGVTLALMVAGLYLIIQQFENHLIYPLVVKKVVGVPPLLVIIALIIGAQLAGFLGIILSVPVAAALQELVSDIQKEKKLLATKK